MRYTRTGPPLKDTGCLLTAAGSFFNSSLAAGVLALCLLATGCLSPLAKHTAAFSTATKTVVDNSKDAYRGAMDLRVREQTVAAVYAYDKNPQWSPYKDVTPLLTPDQLEARIKVLDGLKAYAATLVELTSGKATPDQTAAATAAGSSLQSLNQSVAMEFSTALPNAPVMSDATANGVSTAVLALAQYLSSRKVKGTLPKVTQDMNPQIQTLCKLLEDDTVVLRRQADVDYQQLATDQDLFIRNAGTNLNPIQHRAEVGKLVAIANEQKAHDALLAQLQSALVTLVLTHQALAAAAQGNNPESLSQKIADLQAAGTELGNYYNSLAATTTATTTTTTN
jgi:hypothetical protein